MEVKSLFNPVLEKEQALAITNMKKPEPKSLKRQKMSSKSPKSL